MNAFEISRISMKLKLLEVNRKYNFLRNYEKYSEIKFNEIWSCLTIEDFIQPPNPIAIYPTYLF